MVDQERKSLPTTDDGTPIITQSLLNAWAQNPLNVYYQYVLGLSPKEPAQHIVRGLWIHDCLEQYYLTGSWQKRHGEWASRNRMPQGGEFSREIYRTLRGYEYYYQDDDIEVLSTELPLEAKLPCGYIFRGKLDAVVKTSDGRTLIVDHKTTKRVKSVENQLLHIQAPMYMWLCEKNGVPVDGFMWNYLVSPGPQPPKIVGHGSRLAARQPQTDYPTIVETLSRARDAYGSDWVPQQRHREEVDRMAMYHREVRLHGAHAAASQLYRRLEVPCSDLWVENALRRVDSMAATMWGQDWSDEGRIPMSPDAYWSPSAYYRDLASAYVLTGDSSMVAAQSYTQGDPMERYKSK